MNSSEELTIERLQGSFLLLISMILILSMLVGCSPSTEDLEAVDYTPVVAEKGHPF